MRTRSAQIKHSGEKSSLVTASNPGLLLAPRRTGQGAEGGAQGTVHSARLSLSWVLKQEGSSRVDLVELER